MWSVVEWIARWSAFAVMFMVVVPVELAACAFMVAAVALGLLADALDAAVGRIATQMDRVIGPGDE